MYKPTRPNDIDKIIRSYTKKKVPHFFIYAKDKTESQVEPINDSVMNRISLAIASPRISFSKSIDKFDYRMLMNLSKNFSIQQDNPIVKSYDYWNVHQYLFNTKDENHVNQEDMYMFQQIRRNIMQETKKPLDYIVNSLVIYLYTVKKNSGKKLLWACFGDILYKNICNNLKEQEGGPGKICPICGKRFWPKQSNYGYCSDECRVIARREYLRIKQEEFRNKKKNKQLENS